MLTDANGEERKGIEVFDNPINRKDCFAATIPFVVIMSDYYRTIRDLMLAGF